VSAATVTGIAGSNETKSGRGSIIINILFVPQYKTKQRHKLQINLESAVYTGS